MIKKLNPAKSQTTIPGFVGESAADVKQDFLHAKTFGSDDFDQILDQVLGQSPATALIAAETKRTVPRPHFETNTETEKQPSQETEASAEGEASQAITTARKTESSRWDPLSKPQ